MSGEVKLLDIEGVALRMACSSRQVRRLMNSGQVPQPVRIGGSVRWPSTKIDAWINDGCPKIVNTSN